MRKPRVTALPVPELRKDFMPSFIGRTNTSVGLGSNDSLQTKVHLEIDSDHWALSYPSQATPTETWVYRTGPTCYRICRSESEYRFRVRLG